MTGLATDLARSTLIKKADRIIASCITASHYQTACVWLALAYESPMATEGERWWIDTLWGRTAKKYRSLL